MKITFYFDPSCPFCWITSRWLLMVQNDRDISIEWKAFSLAIKNGEVDGGESPYASSHQAAHRLLRVMTAAHREHGVSLIDMYSYSGIQHHVAGFEIDDELITNLLNEFRLPIVLIKTADLTDYDQKLSEIITSATDVAGEDIGVPTIVFTAEDGSQQGFFGPVLQKLPSQIEGLELWDGLSKLASNSSFYELKRSRPDGGPDVASTAKC